ncbi:DUF3221 domain-containing protein [Bacillus sp. AK128]
MLFSKYIRRSLVLLLFGSIISGCSVEKSKSNHPDTTGYILEVEGNRMLLAERITSKEFDEIKDTPLEELVNKENLYLIYITYDDVKDFNKGNEIDIWLEGEEIEASNPGQAKAEKVVLIE